MRITRRAALAGMTAAPAVLHARVGRASAKTLKISHQFPGNSIDQGDFRDRLVRRFAAEVQTRTNGELAFEIYPGSSLMKTVAQFSAVRRGALDFTLYPLAYAGGEVPELNIGLMPSLVRSYGQGMSWKHAEIGRSLSSTLEAKGVKIITWIWQAGGIASRSGAVVSPQDVRGLKFRGGSREMDLMLKSAGAISSSVPSNEIYAAMQTGALDAAVTSSTSLISFRLEEISKAVTIGTNGSFWFMFEPLLMSKSAFDSLSQDQQKAIAEVGSSLELFAVQAAHADDESLAAVYSRVGAKVASFDAASLEKWQEVARASAWKDFAERSPSCAALLKLADRISA